MTILVTALVILAASATSFGKAAWGESCLQSRNRLNHGNYQLTTDCNAAFYCAANSTCAYKGCRREDFPFGYNATDVLPPKCGAGEFCPDEEDACLPLTAVGQPCQLNRDDQCAPPDNAKELSGPRNVNGAICLNFQCMWSNATLGTACIVENIPYVAYDQQGGHQYISIISRGNCAPGLYCDAPSHLCKRELDEGAACSADKECSSNNCELSGKCGKPTDTPKHLAMWVYIVVGVAIFGGMFGTLITLFFLHRRWREAEQEKRSQYWREQEAFRNNILSMREQARASLLSLPWQAGNNGVPRGGAFKDSDYPASESSQTGMLHAASNPSGLRNGFSDVEYENNSAGSSIEDSLVINPDDDDNARRRKKPSVRVK